MHNEAAKFLFQMARKFDFSIEFAVSWSASFDDETSRNRSNLS